MNKFIKTVLLLTGLLVIVCFALVLLPLLLIILMLTRPQGLFSLRKSPAK